VAYYRDCSGKCDQSSDQFLEIFSEFDFDCFDNTCDFYCPGCINMLKCEIYFEIMGEWKSFYS
jgi:hypothetical protein